MNAVRRLFITAALALVAGNAAAQQTILQGGTYTAGHVPVYAPGSGFGNPVVIDSGLSPGAIASGTAGQMGYYATTGAVISGNANANISTGALTLGITGTSQGSLILSGVTSGAVSILAQPAAGTFNFNLPTTAGTSGTPLLSAGGSSSPMTWGTLSGNTSKFATVSGSLTNGNCVVADASGNLRDNGQGCGGSGTVNSGTAAQTAYYAGSGTAVSGTSALTLSATAVTMTPSGAVTINPTTAGTIDNMAIGGSTRGAAAFTTLTANGNVTLSPTGTVTIGPSLASTMNNVAIGGSTPLAVTSTALTATGAVALSPASANVAISPTGTGTVTINPASSGTMDNVTIGATTRAAGSFTTATATTVLAAGTAGSSLGSVNVSGNTSGTITIKPQAAAGTYNYNLPNSAGTSGQPMISGGGGATAMSWGTLAGNTTSFATTNGALTNGHCVSIDSSGNFQDAGAACATGSGTVNSGTSGQLTYYASSTNAVSGNANANISGGALTLGVANSVIGKLLVTGSTSGTITIQPQAAAGTFNFNLPITAGTSGLPLLSAGGGASPMVWGTLTGNTTKFATASGSYTTGNCVSADASGNLVDNGTPCGTGGSGTVVSSTAGQIAYYPTSTSTVAGNPAFTISSGTLTHGIAGTTQGKVALTGVTSGTITITGQAAAGTWEFDLPTTAGIAGQVLTSQGGAGTAMTWTTAGIGWGGAPKTVNFNATANTRYCIDTLTTGAVTMTLPASPADGDQIGFIDCKSNFATTAFTVARNGNKIMGLTADMTVNTANAASTMIYSSTLTDWRMY